MFCTACGVKNPADSNFCKQCGKALEKPVKIDESDYIHAMPEDEQARALLESAYQHRARGDFDGAIGLCEEALRIQPNSAATHSLIAQIALQQGDKIRAIREYERVLQLNPNSIADKIRLDELRAGKSATARPSGIAPNEGGSMNPLLVVAACAGLLAVGWVMSDQWRKTQGKTDPLTNQTTLLQSPAPSQLILQNPNASNSPNMGGSMNPANSQTAGNQAVTPSAQPANDGSMTISAPPFYPPVMLSAATQGAQGGGNANFNNRFSRGGGGGLPPFNPQNAGLEEIYRPAPGTKVHIENGNEKDPDKDPPKYIVKVDMGGKAGAGANVATPGNPSATSADPVAIETRQAIEVANNSIQRNDFDGAIRALKAAQKNPGTHSARIRQDLATCYKEKGNKATAKTYYEQAIADYEAQIKQGVQKEVAEDGIRVCKRGIKQCE